jgi:CBS domain-containing protein
VDGAASQIGSTRASPSRPAVAQPSDLPTRPGDFWPCSRAAHRGHTDLEVARNEGSSSGREATELKSEAGVMSHYLQDKVQGLARQEAVFVGHDETLRNVARTMWLGSVGALVVGDERHPLGVISERDLVAKVGQGVDLDKMTAEEAMTRDVVSARVGDSLYDAAYQMLDGVIRHLPLVDDNGRVIGMVSVRDLLRPLLLDAVEGPERA